MSYTLQSVYAGHRFIYEHPTTTRDNNGFILSRTPGWVIRFTPYGKRRDPLSDDNEVVQGTPMPVDGLAAHYKARKGKAMGKLELAEEAEKMRLTGYPDMTEEKLLQWFVQKHSSSRGVEWNVYDEYGKLVPDEDLELSPAAREAARDSRGDLGNDEEFIEELSDNKTRCHACQKDIGNLGLSGHRRSKVHWQNVEAALEKRGQAEAVAV